MTIDRALAEIKEAHEGRLATQAEAELSKALVSSNRALLTRIAALEALVEERDTLPRPEDLARIVELEAVLRMAREELHGSNAEIHTAYGESSDDIETVIRAIDAALSLKETP